MQLHHFLKALAQIRHSGSTRFKSAQSSGRYGVGVATYKTWNDIQQDFRDAHD